MKGAGWKIWVLTASVVLHALLLAWLKMPDILPYVAQTSLILNLIEKPKPPVAEPEPEKEKPSPAHREKTEEKKEKPKPKLDEQEMPPPPLEIPDDVLSGDEPVINPDPAGEQGGIPGGVPGGTGDESGLGVEPETPPAPEPETEPEREPEIDVSAIRNSYIGNVKSKIYARKYYPEQAERLEHEGSVKVRFTVNSSGGVSGVSVAASSGYSELDSAAVAAVKNAAPFKGIPSELGKSSLTMVITLKFYLN
ncbi:TonB family protein [bacterium]|nr:TonB family protein [bacterium]